MMLSADESQETTREKEGPQRARGNAVNSVQEHFACNEASSASDWIEIVAAWTACIFCVAGRHVVFASWRSARNAGRKTVEQGSGAVHQALIRPSVAGEAICYAFSLASDSTNQATDSLEVPLNAELRDKGGHWDAKKAWLHVQQSLITRSASARSHVRPLFRSRKVARHRQVQRHAQNAASDGQIRYRCPGTGPCRWDP